VDRGLTIAAWAIFRATRALADLQRSRRFWLALVAASAFVSGFAVDDARFHFRYSLDVLIARLPFTQRSAADARALIAAQARVNPNAVAVNREIDTALLPLRLRGLAANAAHPIAAVAGGVTMVANRLLIMDRLGNFLECSGDCSELAKVPLPQIPNNIEQYAREHNAYINEKDFRAHCVRFSSGMNMLAVSHEYFDPELKSTRFAVSILSLDPATLQPDGPWATVFLGDPQSEGSNDGAGGALAWGADGKLFVAVGDYFSPLTMQDPNSSFGKIFEIDVRAKSHKALAIGLRNPEGLLLSDSLGLISLQQGLRGGDRLDRVTEGANFGYPLVALGTDYRTYSIPGNSDAGRLDDFVAPMFAWVPSIAPSELIELRDFDKRWDGDLIVASLKAQTLFRLRLDHGRVVYAEPIFIGKRIRDLAIMKPGVLALWTDDAQLVLMSIDLEKLASDKRHPFVVQSSLKEMCMVCHYFGATNSSDYAPSLSGLLGRPIASERFAYSPGLRRVGGLWTSESLRRFLTDPAGFANGTTMPNPEISRQETDEIVAEFERFQREAADMDLTR
jgi:cytochrome c2